ncbi:glycosyltransferase family 2 protein [Spirilliplanes yamanashiensis]|uniref:glycosyltransferase family 2 protein n=1 Tax=Spirilliplanes yamanashiensis TaxID=42233 RepID=UPI0027D7C607|nr:glycosyltransferase family 2 protein [Spirilliplanes yamanashiensis]
MTVVIPARNEARNLAEVLPRLPQVHEVVVVDGNSVDGTVETVRRVMPAARIVTQTRRGKGNALACGFAEATGDIIVMFDADGSADPEEIARFVAVLTEGADVAKGSRVMPGGGSEDITVLRGLGNRALTWFTNRLFRTRYSDLCYGYNAFWRDVLPSLALPSPHPAGDVMRWGDGFEIETVLNCRVAVAGLTVREVPSVELSRIHGVSNLSAVRDGLRVLRTILTERTSARQNRAIARAVQAAPHVIPDLVPVPRPHHEPVPAGAALDEATV